MKYLVFFALLITGSNCTPHLSPDADWGEQRWVLVEMKGVPVQQSGGRNDAFIRFVPTDKSVSGNGGCNSFNGNYSIDKHNVSFNQVVSTKMACPDIEFENVFLSVLHEVNSYEIKGDDLLLKGKKQTLLVLRSRSVNR